MYLIYLIYQLTETKSCMKLLCLDRYHRTLDVTIVNLQIVEIRRCNTWQRRKTQFLATRKKILFINSSRKEKKKRHFFDDSLFVFNTIVESKIRGLNRIIRICESNLHLILSCLLHGSSSNLNEKIKVLKCNHLYFIPWRYYR